MQIDKLPNMGAIILPLWMGLVLLKVEETAHTGISFILSHQARPIDCLR
jgi:hypothetical protein